jgi:hypothetical protein
MANVGTRTPVSGGTTAPIPSMTLAIINCTFDSSAATLVLTNGTATHYVFRDLSGAFAAPLAYWYVYTATPTAATLFLAISLTAGTNVTLTGSGNITATSNGTLFLLGPGSLT